MRSVLFLILFWACSYTHAQTGLQNSGQMVSVHGSYGFFIPVADFSSRYGTSLSPGLQVEWMSEQQNWIVGLSGLFFFGTTVKEDVLAPLRNNTGNIIGNDRSFADIGLRQRAWMLGVHLGKLLPLSDINPRSGLRLSGGIGYLQHKIRIQDDPMRNVPALTEDRKKGYDRLSGGVAIYHAVGYQLLSKDGRINFLVAIEGVWGFTDGLRSFQYDTGTPTDQGRIDGMLGIRAAWTLPFYFSNGESIYY